MGLPLHPKDNRLAVRTEDHPIDFSSFEGDIPAGEYGDGSVILWDQGRYELEKWTDREVKVVFHGHRATGRYVFFQTRGRDWMVHRMAPPPIPDWEPVLVGLRPMMPTDGTLPRGGRRRWTCELASGGVWVSVAVEGGRTKVTDAEGNDVAGGYPELHRIGPALGSRACLFDGDVVALGADGWPDRELWGADQPGRGRPERGSPGRRRCGSWCRTCSTSTVSTPARSRIGSQGAGTVSRETQ